MHTTENSQQLHEQNLLLQEALLSAIQEVFYDPKLFQGKFPSLISEINAKDNYGQTLLHHAILSHDEELLSFLISLKGLVDINARNMADDAPLHVAVKFGYYQGVVSLLQAGANVYVTNAEEELPIHEALIEERIEITQALLNSDALKTINVCDKLGYTAAHWAAFKGRIDLLWLLIENGADITLQDVDGLTPLTLLKKIDPILGDMVENDILEVPSKSIQKKDPSYNNHIENSKIFYICECGDESLSCSEELSQNCLAGKKDEGGSLAHQMDQYKAQITM